MSKTVANRALIFAIALFPGIAMAFESTSTSLFPLLSTSGFKNLYSESQTSSTASEYRNVTCRRAIGENRDLFEIVVPDLLLVSEKQWLRAGELAKEIDTLQFKLCNEMVKNGQADSLTVAFGAHRTIVLKLGRDFQEEFSEPLGSLIKQEEEFQEKLNDYASRLQSLSHQNPGDQ